MTKKFFIIAGEASGDLLGSKLIREIKIAEPDSTFVGVGGKLMQEQGLISIFPMEDLAVMGFVEVVPHIFKLLKRIKETAQRIILEKPDFIITIDAPDFNFRVMKKIVGVSSKKIHLIAPSVWAYREGRAKKISKLYDLLFCILPFEPPYFEKYGLRTVFIGHPLCENIPDLAKKIKTKNTVIAITPGSRRAEVKKIFPEFIEAINLLKTKIPNIKIVIPLVDKTKELVQEMAKTLQVEYFFIEKNEKEKMFLEADFALAKSGTNTLEFSLHKIPMIVAYKINWLSYFLIKLLIKIKFGNLINLIANREIIPEMLQWNCRGDRIYKVLKQLVENKEFAEKQINDSQEVLKILCGDVNPSQRVVEEILKL